MSLNRRTGQRFQASIWPGFVDAMTGLLLVLMFVLTIFTVIQFVLMETISGQEDEMSELSSEVAALADALGLERDLTAQLTTRVGGLEQTLEDAEAQVAAQSAMIASLRIDLTSRTNALDDANARITAFENQVAALLSDQETALGRIADLEASEAELMSEQEALNLALATARNEIDAQVEAARLAAAREEALQALVEDLRSQNAETDESLANALAQLADEEDKARSLSQELMDTLARLEDTQGALAEEEKAKLAEQAAVAALRERLADTEAALSEEEKAKLAEAAAAEALRKRLENAQTELTAMTLALEEKRKEAEETLTLLAASRSAEEGLNEKLAAALLANAELDLKLQDTQADLNKAREARENAGSKLSSVEAALVQALLDLDEGTADRNETQAKLDLANQELSRARDRERTLERQLAALRVQVDQGEAALADLNLRYEAEKIARAEAVEAVNQAGAARTELSNLLASARTSAELANETAEAALAAQARSQTQVEQLTDALADARAEADEALIAARTARNTTAELELRLAQVLATRNELIASRDDLEARLASALAAKLAAQQDGEAKADLEEQLARALEAKLAAESAAQDQQAKLSEVEKTLAELRTRLADALLQQQKIEEAAAERMSEADKAILLLATAEEELNSAKTQNQKAQREMELLNQQVADLRVQMGKLQTLIDEAEAKDVASQVQITSLGNRLNTALTRAAAEERRRRQAEEEINALLQAEKDRLEQENKALAKYRSDFFGRLRDLVGEREGVQIVGDRFVFSSEVLFSSGKADLSDAGKNEIANIASLLLDIQDEIPSEIDWVIRVDGHTDNIRVLPGGEFADNWELSQARALSVVRDLVGLGLRPDRLSANGFGQYQPINPANTAEARAQNRRIELKLTER